ncbi:MAG: hypothetical protein ACI9EF_001758 [Pseudohongiellaceae bacterium]|jgi:hypothetical protein
MTRADDSQAVPTLGRAVSRTRRPSALLALCLSALAALPGCAWQNPENRIVWNAFEDNWVPEDEPAFSYALPLTIPGGLVAIVVDSVVVHPATIIDDAWSDAIHPWSLAKWETQYWTESASLPLRVLGTAVLFPLSLVGRSLFDIPPFSSNARNSGEADGEAPDGPGAAWVAAETAIERDLNNSWLHSLLAGSDNVPPRSELSRPAWGEMWDDELQELAERVLNEATARSRIAFHRWAWKHTPPGYGDRWRGLLDHDPRVRAALLTITALRLNLPDDVRDALLSDADPVVAELAWQLFTRDEGP